MSKLKIRYLTILISLMVFISIFILVRFILENVLTNIDNNNGTIAGALSSAAIAVFILDCYLLLIAVISLIGYLIYKRKNKMELYNTLKFQTIILLCIWVIFSFYCFVIL